MPERVDERNAYLFQENKPKAYRMDAGKCRV